jgi:hypothetical protein
VLDWGYPRVRVGASPEISIRLRYSLGLEVELGVVIELD